MTTYLLDTCVLVRLATLADPLHFVANGAVVELHRRGESLVVTAQIMVEFRNVATRPISANGLGLPCAATKAKATAFEASFRLLEETPSIYPAWKDLTTGVGVTGKQVHDGRLVAVCHVHGVTHLLTFNVADFAQMSGFGPGISVVDPANV